MRVFSYIKREIIIKFTKFNFHINYYLMYSILSNLTNYPYNVLFNMFIFPDPRSNKGSHSGLIITCPWST